MQLFLQILEVALLILGSATAFTMLYIGLNVLFDKINEFINRKCKIRCLCKHEYIIDAKWLGWGFIEHVFKCRKCGKVLRIKVFENKVGDEHEV
jgi:hypothetical protein